MIAQAWAKHRAKRREARRWKLWNRKWGQAVRESKAREERAERERRINREPFRTVTDFSWALEAVSLLVLAYSLRSMWKLRRAAKLRKVPPEPPVHVRARTRFGEDVPIDLVFIVRTPEGGAIWTPTPTSSESVGPDADLVAAAWPKGTVVLIGYRRSQGEVEERVLRRIESVEIEP